MNDASRIDVRLIDDDKVNGRYRVSHEAFVSDDILQKERDKIFKRCWLYLGHRSELKERGDFIRREVAGHDIIFNWSSNDQINAFINSCPHRGSAFCQEKSGNRKNFSCFYHGWVFSDNGDVIDRPGAGAGYPESFDSDGQYNLQRVAKLENYRDFYFINFDYNAPTLLSYLGEACKAIDDIADQSDVGMEVVGATQVYSIRSNWKLLAENSIDGYHAMPTHSTYMDYLMSADGNIVGNNFEGPAIDYGNGHVAVEAISPTGRPVAQWVPRWGESGKRDIDAVYAALEKRVGADRAWRIAHMNRNIVIFPNLAIVDSLSLTFRTFYPVSPDLMHVHSWALAPKDETAEMRERRVTAFLEFFAPGGLGVPDDIEALEACQRGYRNRVHPGWNDISKGYHNGSSECDDELQMRAFWKRWNELVTEQSIEDFES